MENFFTFSYFTSTYIIFLKRILDKKKNDRQSTMVIDNGRPRTLVRGGSLVTDIGGWEVVVWLISFG